MLGVPPLITSLTTFTGAEFFLCDEMHLIGRNMGSLVLNLVFEQDKFKLDSADGYAFDLTAGTLKDRLLLQIYEQMRNSRVCIPRTFEGHWNGNDSRIRAVDLQDTLLYIVPTMVFPHLRHEETREALMDLINGCSIALQWSISTLELNKMNR